MKAILVVLGLVFAASHLAAQDAAPQWQMDHVKDAFLGTDSIQYRLEGKYLATPFDKPATPAIYLLCTPGPNNHGKYDGKLENAYLFVGDPGERHTYERRTTARERAAAIQLQYRLDDGKVHTQPLAHSADFKMVSLQLHTQPLAHSADFKMVSLQPEACGECMINDLFYGHIVPHKENSSPQIKKVVFNIPQSRGGNVVIQFDLPDVTEVARTCGVTYHK